MLDPSKLSTPMYSTDYKQLHAHSCFTPEEEEGGVSALEQSMQHSRVVYEWVHINASRRIRTRAMIN